MLGASLVHLAECGSTNDEAARLARDNAPHGTVVIADRQHAGRGRDGRSWSSPAGAGLYMSVVLRPALPLAYVPPLTLALGVATCDAARAAGAAAQLKWPNDVFVAGRKLAGILVETQSRGDRLDAVIAGIGVNLKCSEDQPATAIALAEAGGQVLSPRELAALLLPQVEYWVERYVADGLPAIVAPWRERMASGLAVRAGEVSGTAVGLDDDGSLLVRDARGTTHRVRSGDVSMTA